jgi:hypothetical protein
MNLRTNNRATIKDYDIYYREIEDDKGNIITFNLMARCEQISKQEYKFISIKTEYNIEELSELHLYDIHDELINKLTVILDTNKVTIGDK